ncbi:MAG: GNAT family N-acetyltransferase [Desulfobulbus sp.]|nr:GNAT family N-acetyltransferase [Desulfobulbus sp.]
MNVYGKYRNYSWEFRRRVDEVFRRTESVLLEYDVKLMSKIIDFDQLHDEQPFYIENANATRDMQDIVATFPDDLGFPTPAPPEQVLRHEISARFDRAVPCFVARDRKTSQLLGAVWLPEWYYPRILSVEKRRCKTVAVSQLYTVRGARGQGIATALLQYAMASANTYGYAYCFSLVAPKRIASLRTHLKVGFRILGSVVHGSILGKKFQKFRNSVNFAHGSFPIVPVVIISTIRHDGSTMLSALRALGRNGIPVFILAKGPMTYTGISRYAKNIELFTNDLSDEELIERISRILAKIGWQKCKPVLMILSENDIFRLHSIKSFLEKHFTIVPSDHAVSYLEKENQLPLAIEAGFSVPQSIVLRNSDDVERVSERLQFPIIVKPHARHTVGSFKEKVLIFHAKDAFAEKIVRFFQDKDTELLVQEYIPGSDENVLIFMASCDVQGRVRSFVSGRKLRQVPPGFGFMSSGIIEKNEEMEAKSIKLCQLYQVGGFLGVEAKQHQVTGALYYIETNFRPEAISALAEIAGVNLVLDVYLMAIGQYCFASSSSSTGSYLNLQYEIDAIRHLVREGKAKWWRELLRPLPRPTAYSLYAPDDPLPFFGWLIHAVRVKMFRFLRYARGKKANASNEL